MVSKRSDRPAIVPRPPVVCVLGHVDHGKTTILDYIRKTKVASAESGGITQHIGAYQVKLKAKSSRLRSRYGGQAKLKATKEENLITFIDTPGHAAFVKLRARGAQVTDIAVLVIDAIHGVKPQTVECLQHIREAKIPFLVAINKMDLPDASPEMVKSQLAENKVLVEGYGGDVVAVPISAKTGQGVDELLEMIVLLAQMQELKANLKAQPQAVVIEVGLDPRRGPLATLLVKDGILKVGDLVVADEVKGKIRAMLGENGKRVLQAQPSKPLEVLGFRAVPKVGSLVKVVERHSDRRGDHRRYRNLSALREHSVPSVIEEVKKDKLKLILRADAAGSLEAIRDSLPQEVLVIFSGVGEVTESDVLLSASTGATILAFRVSVPLVVKKLARFEKIKIKHYELIYQLLEDIKNAVLRLLEPAIEEEILGEAEVIAQFKIKGNHIAGCRIKKGQIAKSSLVHIKRGEEFVADSKIKSLQRKRQDIEKGKAPDEVGVVFSSDVDFAIGDAIISYNRKT